MIRFRRKTKDPKLMAAKKALLQEEADAADGVTYWNADQFARLQIAPPARLASKGRLTWRRGWRICWMPTPAVEPIRQVIRRRLMDLPSVEAELKRLTKMLVTLAQMGDGDA